MPFVMKSGIFNLLEPSGPVTGIALPFIVSYPKRIGIISHADVKTSELTIFWVPDTHIYYFHS